MEADELQKKMSDLCDLNADLQVGPSLVLVFSAAFNSVRF